MSSSWNEWHMGKSLLISLLFIIVDITFLAPSSKVNILLVFLLRPKHIKITFVFISFITQWLHVIIVFGFIRSSSPSSLNGLCLSGMKDVLV